MRDVAVIGGGIVGLAVARKVARGGGRVVVIDREDPGRHASWAAAGMLAPQAEAGEVDEAFASLLLKARGYYPALVRELEAETGTSVGYRTEGMLLIALDTAEAAALEERAARQEAAGLPVRRVSAAEVRQMEPSIGEEAVGALFFPNDHQVENRQLTRAYHASARNAGAEFRLGAGARSIEGRPGGIRVALDDGDTVDASAVVIAAGSWSGQIAGLPAPLPVEPVHGQLIAIEMAPPPLRHTLATPDVYMVPRLDGRLIIGATSERVGFRRAVTMGGLRRLVTAALRLIPGMADRPVLAQWSGLRPGTPDGLPILGRDPAMPRVIYATGHYRNGILLAPLTGELVGTIALGGAIDEDLTPYGVDRFRH